MSPYLVVSLHDVAPATFDESRAWLDLVEAHGLVASLLVVPGPWRSAQLVPGTPFVEWLRAAEARGHEVALHGWEHTAVHDPLHGGSPLRRLRAQVRARGCAEFAELGAEEARRRITLGRQALCAAGFDPVGFVPPGWLAMRSTDAVLRDEGFAYTTTQWQVRDVRDGTIVRVASTSQRPGSALTAAAAAANLWIAHRCFESGRSLRIALHPDEIHDARLVRAADRMLLDASVHRHRTITYAELVGVGRRAHHEEHVG